MSEDRRFEVARQLEEAGDLAEAAEAYRELFEARSDHADAWGRRGLCLMRFGTTEEALGCLERACALEPRKSEWLEGRGVCLLALARFDEAEEALKQAVGLDARNGSAWLAKAVAEIRPGNERASIESAERALQADPMNFAVKTLLSRARAALATGGSGLDDRSTNNDMLELLLQSKWTALLDPDRPGQAADPAAADRNIVKTTTVVAIEYIPNLPKILPGEPFDHASPPDDQTAMVLAQGAADLRAKRHAEALSAFDRVIEAHPDAALAHAGRFLALMFLNRNEEAFMAGGKAYSCRPEEPMAMLAGSVSLAMRGDPDFAMPILDRLVKERPRYADAWFARGMVQTIQLRPREAVRSLERAMQLDPDHGSAAAQLGCTLFGLGKVDEGLQWLERGVDLGENPTSLYSMGAMTLATVGRRVDALEILKHCPPPQERDTGAMLMLGLTYRDVGDYEEAVRWLRKAVAANPSSPDYWSAMISVMRIAGREEEALETLRRGSESRPEDAAIWTLLARESFVAKRNEEALEAATIAASLAPRDFRALSNLGALLLQAGRRDEAIEVLRRAVAVDDGPSSSISLASALTDRKGRSNAEPLRVLRAATARYPTEPEVWRMLSYFSLKRRRHIEAYNCCLKSLSLDRGDMSSWIQLTVVLDRTCRMREALGAAKMAVAIAPNDPKAMLNLGNVYLNMEDTPSALGCAERLVAIAPESPSAHVLRGHCLWRMGKVREAGGEYELALMSDPGHVNALVSQGNVLGRLRCWGQAGAMYARALARDPKNREAVEGRARSLAKLGRRDEAKKLLRDSKVPAKEWIGIIGLPRKKKKRK